MKLLITTYVDEAGWHVAECPALPGCLSQGRTHEEALANIIDAARGWLEVEGQKREHEVSYPLDIQVEEVEIEVPA